MWLSSVAEWPQAMRKVPLSMEKVTSASSSPNRNYWGQCTQRNTTNGVVVGFFQAVWEFGGNAPIALIHRRKILFIPSLLRKSDFPFAWEWMRPKTDTSADCFYIHSPLFSSLALLAHSYQASSFALLACSPLATCHQWHQKKKNRQATGLVSSLHESHRILMTVIVLVYIKNWCNL